METKASGQPADSHEERIDLAVRSAAGDPTAEPRSNPPAQSPNPSHTKNASLSGREAPSTQSQLFSSSRSPESSHSKTPSINGSTIGQSKAKEASKPNKSKEHGAPSKGPPEKQAIVAQLPGFVIKRNDLFDRLNHERHTELLAKEKPEVNVVLDLGLDKDGMPRGEMPVMAKAWESTPGSFLRHMDKDFNSDIVIAKVDGKQLWDLDRPLEYACRVSYVPFSSPEGRNVFWHSSAHVLGEAAECQFNCLLSHGPPVEQGFFYDMAIAEG